MDSGMLVRLGAIVFGAVILTATVIGLARKEEAPQSSPVRLHQSARDPLRDGQRRCQLLGQKAADDAECLDVWAKTRDRFLGRTPAPTAPEGR